MYFRQFFLFVYNQEMTNGNIPPIQSGKTDTYSTFSVFFMFILCEHVFFENNLCSCIRFFLYFPFDFIIFLFFEVFLFLKPYIKYIQGDQLNMAVFISTLEKVTYPLYTSISAYTDHFIQGMYQKNTAMFNWSPCIREQEIHRSPFQQIIYLIYILCDAIRSEQFKA